MIQTVKRLEEFSDSLFSCSKKSLLIVDVDATVITPMASVFNTASSYRNFLDEFKAGHCSKQYKELLVSYWRLKRKIRLVESGWPNLIASLQSKNIVDDKLEQCEDVDNYIQTLNIESQVYHYRACEYAHTISNEPMWKLQKDMLLNSGIWLEDEEAMFSLKVSSLRS